MLGMLTRASEGPPNYFRTPDGCTPNRSTLIYVEHLLACIVFKHRGGSVAAPDRQKGVPSACWRPHNDKHKKCLSYVSLLSWIEFLHSCCKAGIPASYSVDCGLNSRFAYAFCCLGWDAYYRGF